MEAAEYVRMATVQNRHWWFEAKRRTVAALLERHAPELRLRVAATGRPQAHPALDADPRAAANAAAETVDAISTAAGTQRVLEVGPGTGSMIEVMTRYGRMYAADAYLPALRLLIEHRLSAAEVALVGADLLELPFPDARFALVGCFDVLYHQRVGDVAAAIAELHRVCAPGGYLAITDSAFPILRSSHDVATHAARRFRLPDLIGLLRGAGFEIAHATYLHALLFPAALAVRLGKRALHGAPALSAGRGQVEAHSDLAPVAGWLNALLLSLYRIETPLAVRFRLPFGSSLMILARRPA